MSSRGPSASGSDAVAPAPQPLPATHPAWPGAAAPAAQPPEPVAASLRTGMLVADRYEVIRFVAKGGMGEVYEAHDRELGQAVALKLLSPSLVAGAADTPAALERFRREVQLARSVQHPNVCRLFDLGRHRLGDGSELPFLTMEYLPGESLAQRLRRTGPLPLGLAARWARDVAAALAAAHAAGVVHRDLKPGNILLVPAPGSDEVRAVVTDFGVARRFDVIAPDPSGAESPADSSLTVAGMVIGTPAYMAPEQLLQRDVTPRTDVYAFGAVLYEMVTGQQPHPSDGKIAGAFHRLTDAPVPPRRLRPDLPVAWERTILRCLRVAPEERFGNLAAVMAALGRRDRRAGLTALGLAALAAAAALALLWPRQRQEPPEWAPGATTAVEALVPAAGSLRLTTDAGLELDPAFSPDGRTLAYAADRSGGFEIYLRPLPGGGERQVTADGQGNAQPAWSPDGSRLAYHSAGRRGIWTVPVAGGYPRRLTDFGSRPSWSPDGRRVVFQSDAAPHLPSALGLPPSTLWVVEVAGGAPRQLTRQDAPPGGHAAPSWSPDGTRIVFTAADAVGSRGWLLDPTTGAVTPLDREGASVFHAVFAPDGRSVLFSSARPGATGNASDHSYALWQVALPGPGEPPAWRRPVATLGLPSARQLAVSRDGRLAHSAIASATTLWSLPLEAGSGRPAGPARALDSDGGSDSRPAFSPDGERLAFDRWRPGSQSDLWLRNARDGAARQLTFDPAFDSHASWLPDGRALLFLSGGREGKGLWRLDLAAAGPPARVALFAEQPDWFRPSPDGSRVAYHRRLDGATNLWIRDLASGAERQITDDPELIGYAVWTPDGRTLIAERNRGESTHLVSVAPAGGPVTQLTSGPGQAWPYSVSPDGDKVAFAGFRDRRWNVWWVSRRTRQELQLTERGDLDGYVRFPAWSPRDDELVYVESRLAGDLWLLPPGALPGSAAP